MCKLRHCLKNIVNPKRLQQFITKCANYFSTLFSLKKISKSLYEKFPSTEFKKLVVFIEFGTVPKMPNQYSLKGAE